jgi:CBS domain-containing protein
VDAARVLALAAGSGETGTAARLAASGEPASRADAFHFIQGLRLGASGNHVAVARLSAIERRVLKEALREAVRLQDRLRVDYP